MPTTCIDAHHPCFPHSLLHFLGPRAPQSISAIGNPHLLKSKSLALFSSVRCPGNLILHTYDLAQALRDSGVAVIAGFHSPMEQECLRLLLRGKQPVILCPARAIDGMRVPSDLRVPIEEGRLLVLSPFSGKHKRLSSVLAPERNRFVAALADKVLAIHAEPGGKVEQLCREVTGWGKPLYTLADDANANLVALGARAISVGDAPRLLSRGPDVADHQAESYQP
ncbi:MAG: DNA-processing protein DprA [Chloroflexi bacterium]|nr:DNA-processing protein DprA [Chloroflexota bacterium]